MEEVVFVGEVVVGPLGAELLDVGMGVFVRRFGIPELLSEFLIEFLVVVGELGGLQRRLRAAMVWRSALLKLRVTHKIIS